MLIAGATNSGKSVCLNSIIASILVRARPDEVRFSLIDPKRVELTLYRGIRHLMHDVVVEPKQAVIALRRSIEEMDRRYKLFAARGVRNIVSYNAKLKEGEKPLPYIVIVIDELADCDDDRRRRVREADLPFGATRARDGNSFDCRDAKAERQRDYRRD